MRGKDNDDEGAAAAETAHSPARCPRARRAPRRLRLRLRWRWSSPIPLPRWDLEMEATVGVGRLLRPRLVYERWEELFHWLPQGPRNLAAGGTHTSVRSRSSESESEGEGPGPVQPGGREAPCRLVGRVRVARARLKTLASAAPCSPFPFLPRRCSLAGEDQAGPAAAELLLLGRLLCWRARIYDLTRACVGSVGIVGTRRGRGRPTPRGLRIRAGLVRQPVLSGRQSGHQVGSSLLAPFVRGQ